MSSDEAYSSFLDQANQDTGVEKTSTQSSSFKTKATDTDVPPALRNLEQYYESEADEPFEPVSLSWDGRNMPSERQLRESSNLQVPDEFKDLVEHGSDVSTLTAKDFDPKGQYRQVLQAVEQAGDGKARIFRVHHGSTRAEYYVVGLDKKGKKVVGLKAKAIES